MWPFFWNALLENRQAAYSQHSDDITSIPESRSETLHSTELGLIYVDEIAIKFYDLDADISRNLSISYSNDEYTCDESSIYSNLLKSLPKIPSFDFQARDIPPLFLQAYALYNETKTHRKLARTELIDILSILSSIPKLKKCLLASEMYPLLQTLIGNTDAGIQKPALKCIMKYHPELQGKHAQCLTDLVQEESFRDALSTFNLNEMKELFPKPLYTFIVEVLSRILYAKVVSKKEKRIESWVETTQGCDFRFYM